MRDIVIDPDVHEAGATSKAIPRAREGANGSAGAPRQTCER